MANIGTWAQSILGRPSPVNDASSLLASINPAALIEWTAKAGQYQEWWSWYDGRSLNEEVKRVLKFPLGINPIQWICNKHGRALWGEVADDTSSLIQFSFRDDENKTTDACRAAGRIVNRVMSESNAAGVQLENSVISQITGGCVYRVAYQPWRRNLTYGVRISKVVPDSFIPVWDSEDPWWLLEGYVLYKISRYEAIAKYGIDPGRDDVYYIEHWTPETYSITVDGKTPTAGIQPWGGVNPFGFVPFVYIPHMTRAGGNWGASHIPGLIGLVEEFNSRMADRGDGVKSANIDRPVMRNVSGGVKVRTIGESFQVIDLGTGMPGNAKEPDMFFLEPNGVKGATLSKEFSADLWEAICNDSDTPSIAWGSGDGKSQRSGMTLEMMFWPLTSHIRGERIMHGAGMRVLARMVLGMIATKMPNEVTAEMLTLEPRVKWAKMMPRDRMDKVSEMVQRASVDIVSTANAVTQLSEGEDPDEEVAAIQAELAEQEQAKLEQVRMQLDADMQKAKLQKEAGSDSEHNARAAAQSATATEKKANPRQEK